VQIRLMLGPAGSGKTYRCLDEVRQALIVQPQGPPLLFVAPKQATYQLEQQLLSSPALAGYTRLRILSFERLARLIFDQFGQPLPAMLDDEGRVMVLRGLLSRKHHQLKLFRASARLTGFAQQLSDVLAEFQRDQLTPDLLRELAQKFSPGQSLAAKLEDLATLLKDYLDWLQAHHLQDINSLLPAAASLLRNPSPKFENEASITHHLWLDGFAEFSRQELELLVALMPFCDHATLAFCLDDIPSAKPSWLSSWSVMQRTFETCRQHLSAIPGADLVTEILPRALERNRFDQNPVLAHLEQFWSDPQPFQSKIKNQTSKIDNLRIAACPDPEAEAVLAAREILSHVRSGGRYREAAVLVRNLDDYERTIQSVFARYEIPCFMDRRESVAHHPLPELTRSALRTIALGWQREDFFAALKTGLAPAEDTDIDRLENEALARGWHGSLWHKPLIIPDDPELTRWVNDLQHRIVPPFHHLALALALNTNQPTGPQLAAALRQFWVELEVEARLQAWAAAEISSSTFRRPASVHATVWEQMNTWLENLERAFPTEPFPLREWLPIVEAGLAALTVGVIPPALDQVLVGAIDRSRNPDLKLALVLGMNEGVFPARPRTSALLTDTDRAQLEQHNRLLGSGSRHQLSRERFFGYIACTRPRSRLVLAYSHCGSHGSPLNPSPFIARIRQLFPALPVDSIPAHGDWSQAEHVSELLGPLLQSGTAAPLPLASLPAVAATLESLKHFRDSRSAPSVLSPQWASRLYGPLLRTSVSRLEQFASCPFKFFIHSGLRAEERKRFELDAKEQGSFQHEVLAMFHQQLQQNGKRWRELTPAEARQRIGAIARSLLAGYRDGLLTASDQTHFLALSLTESLQDFVATIIGWMRTQYLFDPVAVELPYGWDETSPAWTIALANGRQLKLRGRIDRVDLCPSSTAEEALCVVVDYKSSHNQLDPILLAHGIQLQLLAYLNVLRHWPNPRDRFGVRRLVPAGVFYVNLRGRPGREPNRRDALADPLQARKLACRHTGRFDLRALRKLDSRADALQGDQFNYRLNRNGQIAKNSAEAMPTADFHALLDSVEKNLQRMAERIYAGETAVAPFRKGSLLACNQCDYQAICRIDPWTHRYRVLTANSHA
jgi:ATP-dependent helicase/nuclease subunit B